METSAPATAPRSGFVQVQLGNEGLFNQRRGARFGLLLLRASGSLPHATSVLPPKNERLSPRAG
jgi:hypothetical protein